MATTYNFTVTHTNQASTATIYWRINDGVGGIKATEFVSDSGTVTSNANQATTLIPIEVEEDAGTGTRNYTLEVDEDAGFASSATHGFTVVDGTIASAEYFTANFDVASIDEDFTEVAVFLVECGAVTSGTTVGYTISGTNITTSDIQIDLAQGAGYVTPSSLSVANGDTNAITINSNGEGILRIKAVADSLETADETLTVTLVATDSASTSTGSLSDSVNIINTSNNIVSGTLDILPLGGSNPNNRTGIVDVDYTESGTNLAEIEPGLIFRVEDEGASNDLVIYVEKIDYTTNDGPGASPGGGGTLTGGAVVEGGSTEAAGNLPTYNEITYSANTNVLATLTGLGGQAWNVQYAITGSAGFQTKGESLIPLNNNFDLMTTSAQQIDAAQNDTLAMSPFYTQVAETETTPQSLDREIDIAFTFTKSGESDIVVTSTWAYTGTVIIN